MVCLYKARAGSARRQALVVRLFDQGVLDAGFPASNTLLVSSKVEMLFFNGNLWPTVIRVSRVRALRGSDDGY